MNKKQYNNVIDYTLKHESSAQTEDSLATARAIFANMGVALPQGDMKTVCKTIKTNEYMGWRSCTMQEAQEAANNGTAAIGISEDRIVVLSANDKEQPVAQTTSVMTLDENTSAYSVAGLEYYTYSYDTITYYDNTWNETVFTNLDALHRLAKQYDGTNPLQLTLQFIRRTRYGDGNWNVVAGEVNQNFVEFVRNNNPYIYNFFTRSSLIIYDYDSSPIDFMHLCATMNGIIVGGGTYWKSLLVGRTHVQNLAGWAGDLQTLVVDTYVLTNASNNYNTFYNTFYQIMGSDQHSFSMKDLLADVDALNFANNWHSSYWQTNLFGSACRYYYNNTDIPGTGWTSRADLRFSQFFGSDTKAQFSSTVANYTKQNWMLGIEWPIYESQAAERGIIINLTSNQSKAARDAFTEYMWNKYQSE